MGKRILLFSTYTIKNPRHGGQKRAEAIVEEYRRAGNTVKHVAIQIDQFYPDHFGGDITLPFKKYQTHRFVALVGDLLLADVLQVDDGAFRKFQQTINDFRPDVVELEQPFLYKTVKEALDKSGWNGMIVNSTQNIEADLKRQILENSQGISQAETDDVISQIDELESFAARDADWSVACTDGDAKRLKAMGAADVIVAPNGIARSSFDQDTVNKLKQRYGKRKVILYVGSAHPPNLTGFVDLVGGRLGFLGDDATLVVVGGVADMIYRYSQEVLPNYARILYKDWIELLGGVDEKTLTALLVVADQIILPILEGGGSNLKTAEAILANTKIVATTKSFHSYEKYLGLPNISIADDSEAFIHAMNANIHTKKQPRTAQQKTLADGVLWENTLKDMVEKVGKI